MNVNVIAALQSEMVCSYRQISGCDHHCLRCDFGREDSEIIAAYEAAIAALEKQIPKRPSYIEADYGIFECPTCKEMIESTSDLDTWHYCMNCGQALDWSDLMSEVEE